MPTPENYCQVYRRIASKPETWAEHCHYVNLLEETVLGLLKAFQANGSLLDTETKRFAAELGQKLVTATTEDDLKRIRDLGNGLGLRSSRELTNSSELQSQLIDLIQYVVGSLSSASIEGQWLRGQLEETEELLGGQVSAKNVAKAKDHLREVLSKQNDIHQTVEASQQAIKSVLAEIIRQAAALVEDTAGFESKLSEMGEHIQAANDISAIKSVVGELDTLVKDMGTTAHHSHSNMSATHDRLIQAEQQIADLRKNLAETNEKARRDKLTGTLNRSGLEEIWRRETERADQDKTTLAIGILDVDNFKLLNDKLGHTVGDEALIHLTSVIRNALHGTDTMARYGGEEFVIVLPDTDANGAEAVMRRLQCELTKHFFMHGTDHLLITFSAGVTVVQIGKDTMISAIERADTALYESKRAGKNRVSIA